MKNKNNLPEDDFGGAGERGKAANKIKPSILAGIIKKGGDPSKIDESISIIKQNSVLRLRSFFGLNDRNETEKPIGFFGPSLEVVPESPFHSSVFKDGNIRYSNYSVSIFLFGECSLYRYNADISAINHKIISEGMEEIYYKDIISVGMYSCLMETGIKSPPQQIVTTLEIGTAARTHSSVLRNRTIEATHKKFEFDEAKLTVSFQKLRNIISFKKNPDQKKQQQENSIFDF